MTLTSVEVDSHPTSRVHNSQPHGIGRVAALGGLVAWNNLGRNLVFAGPDLRPRAVLDESVYDEDEPSQYDLDVHAVHELGDGTVVALNHFGTVRAFAAADVRTPGALRRLTPMWSRSIPADVERSLVVRDRLVTSRPRADRAPGLLVSEPLRPAPAGAPVDVEPTLTDWGFVGALAPSPPSPPGSASSTAWFAMGGGGHVAVAGVGGPGRGDVLWSVPVDFEPEFLDWRGGVVWAAGSSREPVDDYDWEAKRGGGFVACAAVDGAILAHADFDVDLAWGNGGVPLALTADALCGLGRRGEVHLFDLHTGARVATTAPHRETSAGIGHAAVIGDHLLFGYNRDGYRLHALPTRALGALSRRA